MNDEPDVIDQIEKAILLAQPIGGTESAVAVIFQLISEAEGRGAKRALIEAADWIQYDTGETSGAGVAEWLKYRADKVR